MRRREFIAGLGSTAAWPRAAQAQQPTMPVIGYLGAQSADDDYKRVTVPFLQGLKETGYVEGRNVAIEYRWAENQPDRLPVLAADLGGNATGFNFFAQEVDAKRLGLLHELVPKAVRVAVLLNPANATVTETTLRDVQQAARTTGLQLRFLNATTIGEIDVAFVTLGRERSEALFVAGDTFFASRRVQFATLATRAGIPAAYSLREFVEVGGLMS
jgi:putative tryptophan/tyrosine transport system substrate-binding protein